MVSQEDADIRTLLRWKLHQDGYVIRYDYDTTKKRTKVVFAHRIIAERMIGRLLRPWPQEVVSHINKNLLDCSRPNLRIGPLGDAVTARQQSDKAQVNNTSSKYRGVTWVERLNRWVASIKVKNKQSHLGCYGSEVDAAIAYDTAAAQAFGELAQLNFPERESL